ncbi:MAG: aspartate--tRNA ligase [Candidatus Marinimicrobia bacterium]|nr:aspartate--tRNA ligase [Candidatus Neomarinimicrobiota bacterium]|tara:strand:- start:2961 stop:4730 length:1770 start_codon:yes stop_codon:yes gene_type:complete
MIKRTHTCADLTIKNLENQVSLNGWISKSRDLGGLIFIDLKDRYGITQIVFNEKTNKKAFDKVKPLGLQDVIGVKGVVVKRPNEAINKDLTTGEIDVEVSNLEIYNEASSMPFDVNDRNSAMEEHRLKYRYLELRTNEMQNNLQVRHDTALSVRNFLSNENFLEIETPILMKSTPEGARDFLVPSRLHSGKFYALPQSPQTYKQLLMVSGLDKYFQIVKCFRDEDFRADRQPEFTQIDIECSFVTEDDIIKLGTDLVKYIWKEVLDVELPETFEVLKYEDAMENYGSDKPDLRFGMPLFEFSNYVKKSDFNVFKSILKNGGRVKAIVCPNGDHYSRKVIDELTDFLKKYHHAKGLAWMKNDNGVLVGGIGKFFPKEVQAQIIKDLKLNNTDIVFMIGDSKKVTLDALGALRLELGKRENLIQDKWKPLWVVDFPLFDWNDDKERWDSLHHPFTSPNPEDLHMLDKNPGLVRSWGYDIVMNGYELGGGSIRIHDKQLQSKIFELLGLSESEADEKFGFLMNAFKYGAPPHGGMAFGFDRIVMLLVGSSQIRDVIAFPKTTSAMSLMDNSPSEVNLKQLDELHISLKDKNS